MKPSPHPLAERVECTVALAILQVLLLILEIYSREFNFYTVLLFD